MWLFAGESYGIQRQLELVAPDALRRHGNLSGAGNVLQLPGQVQQADLVSNGIP